MFADDLLIFAKANEKSAYGIGVALRWSFYATMLFINDSKSNIFHVGISDVIKDSVARSLTYKILGCPHIAARITAALFAPLVDKLLVLLQSWSNKLLAYASRL